MVDKNKKILFIAVCNFLRDNKILEKYCYNAAMHHRMELPRDMSLGGKTKLIFDRLMKRVDPLSSFQIYEFIRRYETAFDWMGTPEGHEFWSEISSKWGREYELYIKKYENMRNI